MSPGSLHLVMKIRPIANYTLLIASYLLLRIICAVLMKTSAVGEKKKKKRYKKELMFNIYKTQPIKTQFCLAENV